MPEYRAIVVPFGYGKTNALVLLCFFLRKRGYWGPFCGTTAPRHLSLVTVALHNRIPGSAKFLQLSGENFRNVFHLLGMADLVRRDHIHPFINV